jgi:hypothetical protein
MGFVISISTQSLADMTKVTVTSSTVIPTVTSLTPTNLVMELVILAHTTQFYVASMEEIVWMMWMRIVATVGLTPAKMALLNCLGIESVMPAITTKIAVGMERIAWNSMPSILRVEENTKVWIQSVLAMENVIILVDTTVVSVVMMVLTALTLIFNIQSAREIILM